MVRWQCQFDGHGLFALNGGPHWEKLSEGGKKDRCGWLKGYYGLSWHIVSSVPGTMSSLKDTEKANRVMKAMLQTGKLDIKTLKQAYEQN